MREKWYGDARDLVKWGVLLTLAEYYGVKQILQVAYLRSTTWENVEIDGEFKPIPHCVIKHFRDIQNVEKLVGEPRIQVLDLRFEDRALYEETIIKSVGESQHPCILFLDPDTGLEPQGQPSYEHVLEKELSNVWGNLCKGDVLVLYQHQTNRNGQPWIEQKHAQFAKALSVAFDQVKIGRSLKIARDVVLLYCSK